MDKLLRALDGKLIVAERCNGWWKGGGRKTVLDIVAAAEGRE